jgi:hypothetical protein
MAIRNKVRRVTLGLALAALLGCSLVVDSSEVDACANGKVCNDRCVSHNDPAFCEDCKPCELPNAIPRCEAGQCYVSACLEGFGCPDCHANLLTDELNCGECSKACPQGWICWDRQCRALAGP